MFHKCRIHGRRICFNCTAFTLGYLSEHWIFEKTPLSVLPHLLRIH